MRYEFSVTLEESDFVEAYRPAPRPRRLSAWLAMLAAVLCLLIGVLLLRFPEARAAIAGSRLIAGLIGAIVLVAGLIAALLAAAPFLRRRAAQGTLDHHPGLRDPVRYSFDDETFAVRTTYVDARYPWEQLWDWREAAGVVIVMPTPRNFYVVPKRALDLAALENLRDRLGAARRRRG